jgi:hypothetical protein
MSISVFPAPTLNTINASSITCTSPFTLYGTINSFEIGIYTISCVSSTVAKVEFISAIDTTILIATTVSGAISVNLATPAIGVRVWTNTGTDVTVTIAKTANAINNQITGVVDTIDSNTTYTQTSTSGYAYVAIIGGGGGGSGGKSSPSGGRGGGSGGLVEAIVALTGSMSATVGAGGTAGADTDPPGNGGAGGTTTFAGYTVTGGDGGVYSSDGTGPGSAGGSPDGVASTGLNGATLPAGYTFFPAGSNYGVGGTGGGSAAGNPGTGYGSGGGGGGAFSSFSYAGGAGAPGRIYVLKF